MRDVDLSGVEVIEKDQKALSAAKIEVEKQAKAMLHKGLEGLNQTQVHNFQHYTVCTFH